MASEARKGLKNFKSDCECGKPGQFFVRGQNYCKECVTKAIQFEKDDRKK